MSGRGTRGGGRGGGARGGGGGPGGGGGRGGPGRGGGGGGGPAGRGGPGGPGGRGRGGPGGPGGPGGGRGGAPGGGGPPLTLTGPSQRIIPVAAVTAIGVKRPSFGSKGRQILVQVNAFPTPVLQGNIYHYDGRHSSSQKDNGSHDSAPRASSGTSLPLELHTMDGRMYFPSHELNLDPATQPFQIPFEGKTFKVRLTHVATINPEVLNRFVEGKQTQDNAVQTAITALNVAARAEPSKTRPFNARYIYSDHENVQVQGRGAPPVDIWRGYFMSIRPAMGRMIVNVDISCGVFYRPGTFIEIICQFLGIQTHQLGQLPNRDREFRKAVRFFSGLTVEVTQLDGSRKNRAIKGFFRETATQFRFTNRTTNQQMTVAQYFQSNQQPLTFPNLLGIKVGSGAYIPLERCRILPGEQMRKEISPDVTAAMVNFSKLDPRARLNAIGVGLNQVLGFGQSTYVQNFGMASGAPLTIPARVLPTPSLKYGQGSKQATVSPANGSWNMIDKKLWSLCPPIERWILISYERPDRFSQDQGQKMVKDWVRNCRKVGISITDNPNRIRVLNPQGNVLQDLRSEGKAVFDQLRKGPDLYLIVIPDGANDLWNQIKHFGDVIQGVATQCVKSKHASQSKDQYWANVCLKVNVKLGGINSIPVTNEFSDPKTPTVVMGADAQHPAPGTDGKPSFTSMVSSVDSNVCKYIATTRVQAHREMIDDFEDMAFYLLGQWRTYQTAHGSKAPPARIIFFRDGVSEGEFSQVLEKEVPKLKAACDKLGIKPKITFIVVGKRHHIRFFPDGRDADRSGNAPAGTVIDTDIVLLNEIGLSPDSLQSMAFTLCHVYAKATRSVSIPAPVYYADHVCDRAKHHFDPYADETSTVASGSDAAAAVARAVSNFKPLHGNQATRMYFSMATDILRKRIYESRL
ncbi:argonaute-like protein [Flagelloscypha sp. PMI_526]|nr:argonaute-like protein [Flagelloscypha sp. PMI_526]